MILDRNNLSTPVNKKGTALPPDRLHTTLNSVEHIMCSLETKEKETIHTFTWTHASKLQTRSPPINSHHQLPKALDLNTLQRPKEFAP
jgi:hypothetical protein